MPKSALPKVLLLGAVTAPAALIAWGVAAAPKWYVWNGSVTESALSDVPGPAIEYLRAQGPKGLDMLLHAHRALIQKVKTEGRAELTIREQARFARLRAAIDQVAAQRDAYIQGLYWYTDLDEAIAQAKASGRPILSLRMLGRLDEALSCANSRFFRTVLYADPEVAARLKASFVLHWSSERPVPKVTIDMGDGRTLQTTVTGNSIHYVLDIHGRPVDALPGLYGPQRFVRELESTLAMLPRLRSFKAPRARVLARYHRDRYRATANLLVELRNQRPKAALGTQAPTAARAVPIAVAKSVAELPLMPPTPPSLGADPKAYSAQDWAKLAQRSSEQQHLSKESIALIRDQGSVLTPTPDARKRRLEALEELINADTMKNEHLLRQTLRQWMMQDEFADLESLNTRVYRTLFLTPAGDPWLGLISEGVYPGLERDGVVEQP